MRLSISAAAAGLVGRIRCRPQITPSTSPRKKSGHRGFEPLLGACRVRSILDLSQRVDVLGAMIVVQDRRRGREELLDPAPDPVRAIGHYTQSHLLFGNQACFLDLPQSGKEGLL